MVDVVARRQCCEAIVATSVLAEPDVCVYDIRIQLDIEPKPFLADFLKHVIESVEVLASIGSLVLALPIGHFLQEEIEQLNANEVQLALETVSVLPLPAKLMFTIGVWNWICCPISAI